MGDDTASADFFKTESSMITDFLHDSCKSFGGQGCMVAFSVMLLLAVSIACADRSLAMAVVAAGLSVLTTATALPPANCAGADSVLCLLVGISRRWPRGRKDLNPLVGALPLL